MRKIIVSFFVLMAAITLLFSEKIEKRWDNLKLGNHRAVVFVKKKSDAVYSKIEWRRRDKNPSEKEIIIIDSKTGKRVNDIVRVNINNTCGELIFKPKSAPAEYFIYYLPYRYKGSKNYPKTEYLKYEKTVETEWLKKYQNLSQAEIKKLDKAKFISLQSVNEFNNFTPMEKVATKGEIDKLIGKHIDKEYLLFPEKRENTIRMFDKIPLKWIKEKHENKIFLKSLKGEYLSFQIGVFPFKHDLENIKLEISDLIGKYGKIKSENITCFNTEGINLKGEKFLKILNIKKGSVLPLWFGIDTYKNIKTGKYKGIIKFKPSNSKIQTIEVNLEIKDKIVKNHGDDNPYNLTRLRWLNSKLGSDNKPVKPYTSIKLIDNKIRILGREIKLGKNGFPISIKSYFDDTLTKINKEGENLLKEPILFSILNNKKKKIHYKKLKWIKKESGILEWRSFGKTDDLEIEVFGKLEYDGFLDYKVKVRGIRDSEIDNIYIELPIRKDKAKYMMGLGYKGGKLPEKFEWKWEREKNQDSVWIGDVNAGVQLSVRGKNYIRPLNTNFYHMKPLKMPKSWYNSGKGGFLLKNLKNSVKAMFYSGQRKIDKGEVLHFYFSLLITPFKPLNTKQHWKNRYFHAYKPIDEIRKSGANIINVHHATDINPFINYPFLRPEKMKKYIAEAHKKGMKVKIYYTVRELSNHSPEIFALKSLGDEIFAPGKGGGPSWLVEHFGDNYIAGWYVPKFEDAAIINNGSSRWHNYYIEGLYWLVKNVGIDGIYIDDIAFDRTIMKRIRRVFEMNGKEAIIDVHSANQYNPRDGYASSANLYLEHFPFINRLWFGEYFNYDSKPDYWLIEISGIPFGLMGEMLQGGGNPYRGMIYGMTARLPWAGNPKPLWKLWDNFGIEKSEMLGYWSEKCPVKTNNSDVLATVYRRKGKSLIAIASWAKNKVSVKLKIDWKKLGIKKEKAIIIAPYIENFQNHKKFEINEKIQIAPKKGWLLIVKEKRGKNE